jgi:hypothetical protein
MHCTDTTDAASPDALSFRYAAFFAPGCDYFRLSMAGFQLSAQPPLPKRGFQPPFALLITDFIFLRFAITPLLITLMPLIRFH